MRAIIPRFFLWLLAALGTSVLNAAYCLVSGSFSYQGGSDLESLNVAFGLYSPDIRLLLLRTVTTNALVLMALSFPFVLPLLRTRGPLDPRKLLISVSGSLLLWFLWVAVAVVRIPTLFSDLYYGDGKGVTAALMRFICGVPGAVTLFVLGLVALGMLWRLGGPRLAASTGAVFGLAAFLLTWTHRFPGISLPDGSVVILMADSLRSDFFSEAGMPKVWTLAQAEKAERLPSVVPPVARTTPAVVSLLTGKLPGQTRVTTMFSDQDTFVQRPTLATELRAAGFCTLAVGDYPAEMLRKYDLGFERLDAPLVRFQEMALQTVLSKNALYLATLSYAPLRRLLGETQKNLFEGLPTFAAPERLMRRLATGVAPCGGRPVFALVFADQPHFPYVQTWPHYLKDAGYNGRYRFAKDATSAPSTQEDRAQIRTLYANSLLATDEAFAQLISHVSAKGQLPRTTIVVTGDHGESLYDGLGIMGHGDQLDEMEGISVPWVVFGRGRELFAPQPGRTEVQTTELAAKLMAIHGLPWRTQSALPPGTLYVETDLWMADTPNVPKERLRYGQLGELLTLPEARGHIQLRQELTPLVELAKHRMWKVDGVRYTLKPTDNGLVASRNGVRVPVEQFPPVVTDYLKGHYPDVAAALLH